jgi:hypothetical protein
MTTAAQKAMADRKTYTTGHKHSRLWETCQRRMLPVTRLADRMDAKWGCDALPRLVSETTAAKWAITQDNLWRVLDAADAPDADADQVEADLEACVKSALRGLEFLDQEAHKLHPNGVEPPESFEWDKDGQRFVVVADALKAAFLPDGIRVVPMTEVAAALAYYDQAVAFTAKTKEHFPSAKLEVAEVPEDEIEF